MKKKKLIIIIIGVIWVLAGCQGHRLNYPINIVSRENGSGTRTAFEELLNVNTNKDNQMTMNTGIKDGNGLVASYVAGNEAAIGYVSFATLESNRDNIRGLSIDGIEPTPQNVLNGSYTLVRPFIVVYQEEFLTDVEKAFLDFLGSIQGLQELEASDTIVDLTDAPYFDASKYGDLIGTMVLGGSTSTEQAVKRAATLFSAIFPAVTFSYDATGSGSGIKNAQDGIYTLGFTSREITVSEQETGLQKELFCWDGIVFIVNPTNSVQGLTVEQVRAIYMGRIKTWDELSS